jgi:hypothetical protein
MGRCGGAEDKSKIGARLFSFHLRVLATVLPGDHSLGLDLCYIT